MNTSANSAEFVRVPNQFFPIIINALELFSQTVLLNVKINMQQYIENTKNLIEYFVNLLQRKACELYAQDTEILIANYLANHPEIKQKFYGELIANAVNSSKNALGTKGDENLFILFNSVIKYDHVFMRKCFLICEMRDRLESLYSIVIAFNNNRNANKSMDVEYMRIFEAFEACANYYYGFFKLSTKPLY